MRMGRTLRDNCNEEQMELTVFTIVNLLSSKAEVQSMTEKIEFAKLYLRAARKASEMSALEMASSYSSRGIRLLPTDRWESQMDLTKSLYTVAARVEACLGNHDLVAKLVDEYLQIPGIPILEKIPIYMTNLCSLESQDGRFEEAIQICISILSQLGQKIPKSKFSQTAGTIGAVLKLKSIPKKLEKMDVSTLTMMTDEKLIASMEILDKMGSLCVIGSSPMLPLVVYRSLELTMKHGLSTRAPAAFSLASLLVVAIFEDTKGGTILADHATNMLERVPNKAVVESITLFRASYFVLSWTRPLNSVVKPLLHAYEVGLAYGDIESAVYSIATYVFAALFAGCRLQPLLDDCKIYLGQMKQLGRDRIYAFSAVGWQIIFNLVGSSDDHLVLTGDAMNQEDFLLQCAQPGWESNLPTFYWAQAFLYAVFGRHELGAAHALAKSKSIFANMPANPALMSLPYYMAIPLLEMARKSKQKKYMKLAKQMISKINNHAKKPNPNVQHYKVAVEGELLAIKNDTYEASSKFEKAISLATRSGLIHDSAMMNERYGEFLLRMDDPGRAVNYLVTAYTLYVEWGATKKADMLREKYHNKFPKPTTSVSFGSDGSSRGFTVATPTNF